MMARSTHSPCFSGAEHDLGLATPRSASWHPSIPSAPHFGSLAGPVRMAVYPLMLNNIRALRGGHASESLFSFVGAHLGQGSVAQHFSQVPLPHLKMADYPLMTGRFGALRRMVGLLSAISTALSSNSARLRLLSFFDSGQDRLKLPLPIGGL
jgi:hypothetical protein